jgi:signal transduction histidine kinase
VTLDLQSKKLEAMMVEITSQKNELEEVGKVKDKLFSVISHDLKTPVNTLISFADLLESSEVKPEKLKSYMGVLKGTLSKTSSLMSNLLQWAASQMHGFKPVITNTNIAEVVGRVLLDAEQQILQKQVIVHNKVPGNVSASADPDMLAVILRNLIANAVKYVPPKTGEVTVGVNQQDGMVSISVKDNGIGLQKDEVEAFNNIAVITTAKSHAGTEKENGTGLGLMLCKTLVKQMNGTISVSHCNDAGTEFSVYIPAA